MDHKLATVATLLKKKTPAFAILRSNLRGCPILCNYGSRPGWQFVGLRTFLYVCRCRVH
jgi:hypothetical protein